MDKAIVIGVGPREGLGAELCARFAREGLHVFVAGRTEAKLKDVVAAIEAEGGGATAVRCDATDEAQVISLFDSAETTGEGELTLAIYNAGNNTPGAIVDMEADYFEASWRMGAYGGFLFGREAIRRMRERGGTILFTGASASLRGRANFGAFNASKAGLRMLAQAMAKEHGQDGIHVGHVVIDGPIGGEKIRVNYPEYAKQKGEAGTMSLEGLADAYVYLYRQPRRAWTFEVDVRTSLEAW